MLCLSMANHEKSKKHKEHLAALKLILQEETVEIQSTSDSDNDSTAKYDRLSDTCGDTVDGHGNTGNDRHDDNELPVSDTNKQLPSNTSNDRLGNNSSVPSTDRGNNDSISDDEDNDILLLLVKNKTKQVEKLPDYYEDQVEPVSVPTTNRPQEYTIQDERCNDC